MWAFMPKVGTQVNNQITKLEPETFYEIRIESVVVIHVLIEDALHLFALDLVNPSFKV